MCRFRKVYMSQGCEARLLQEMRRPCAVQACATERGKALSWSQFWSKTGNNTTFRHVLMGPTRLAFQKNIRWYAFFQTRMKFQICNFYTISSCPPTLNTYNSLTIHSNNIITPDPNTSRQSLSISLTHHPLKIITTPSNHHSKTHFQLTPRENKGKPFNFKHF